MNHWSAVSIETWYLSGIFFSHVDLIVLYALSRINFLYLSQVQLVDQDGSHVAVLMMCCALSVPLRSGRHTHQFPALVLNLKTNFKLIMTCWECFNGMLFCSKRVYLYLHLREFVIDSLINSIWSLKWVLVLMSNCLQFHLNWQP